MSAIINGTDGITFPTWTTGTRPATPVAGQAGFNTTIGAMETYTGSAWSTSDLPATGASGNFLQSTGTAWTSASTLAVSNGGTGLTTTTTAYGVLAAGTTATGALQNIGTGTTGQLLTSNGASALPTFQAAPASGGMTLLGTITVTAANSISLTSLTLTSYKALFIGFNNLAAAGAVTVYVSATNVQSGATFSLNTGNWYGNGWIDLVGGGISGIIGTSGGGSFSSLIGPSGITTASTAVYFRLNAAQAFTAQGSIPIYGVK
jgi:hypothetical protein